MIGIRQRINPILERYGVDMIVSGHSHGYERSYPLHDQYGFMSDYSANPDAYRYADDRGSGRYDGTLNSCPYQNTSEKKKQGTVYAVTGSSGAFGSTGLSQLPVMLVDKRNAGGSLYFDVEDNRLDAKSIQPGSPYTIGDQFTVMKDAGQIQPLVVSAGQSVMLSASFVSDYQWSNPDDGTFSSSSRSIMVSGTAGTTRTYVVRDSKKCIQDTYTLTFADSMITVKSGVWTDSTVWSGNRVPTNADKTQLKHSVTIPANTAVHALRVGFDAGARLNYNKNATLLLGQ